MTISTQPFPLWQCPGLAKMVTDFNLAGYVCHIDQLADFDYDEGPIPVTGKDVVKIANETEECHLVVRHKRTGKLLARILIVPSNGTDWLCDYSYKPKNPDNSTLFSIIEGNTPK